MLVKTGWVYPTIQKLALVAIVLELDSKDLSRRRGLELLTFHFPNLQYLHVKCPTSEIRKGQSDVFDQLAKFCDVSQIAASVQALGLKKLVIDIPALKYVNYKMLLQIHLVPVQK